MRIALTLIVLASICGVTFADSVAQKRLLGDSGEHALLYKEILLAAQAWRRAIEKRSVDSMVEYADADYKKPVKSALLDEKSGLYRLFFAEQNSVHSFFRDTKNARFAAIAHTYRDQQTIRIDGITACFYDPAKISDINDQVIDALLGANMPPAFCEYFFKMKGRWFANYEFGPAIPDTE